MTIQNEKLKRFLEDYNNWTPPSLTAICEHMGWGSKNSASKALKQIGFKRKKAKRYETWIEAALKTKIK